MEVQSALPPSELSARMLDHLDAAEWGMPDLEWRQRHPEISCEEGERSPHSKLQAEDACFVCSARDGALILDYRFYLPGGEDAPRCQLGGLYLRRDAALPISEARALHTEIERRVSGRHPDVAPSTKLGFEEPGSETWEQNRVWAQAARTHHLYLRRASDMGEGKERAIVWLRAVDSRLLKPIAWNSPHAYDPDDDWDWRDRARERIAAGLRDRFPRVAEVIAAPADRDAGELRRLLERVFAVAQEESGERRALYLLAADDLAMQFAERVKPQGPGDDWNPELAGVEFSQSGLQYGVYDDVYYEHSLLTRVWDEPTASEWREYAFLHLQAQGWTGCDEWNVSYDTAIERGESILSSRGSSPFRATHLAFLAIAHETKGSVYRDALIPGAQSRSGVNLDETSLSDIDDPPAEADAALAAARRYYTELVESFPRSPEARYARWRLWRMESGMAPNQWRYACHFRC